MKRIATHLLDALPKNRVGEMLQRGRMHEIARALQEEDGAHRHVEDVFGATAKRDSSNEGQRHTQQQDECSNNASR